MIIVTRGTLACACPPPPHSQAVDYWDQQEPTYNGVLGGFGYVSDIEVRDSKQLLCKVRVLIMCRNPHLSV